MDWIPVLVPLIGVLATALTGAITVYVARKKGLPDLNREIESRMATLVETLESQLEAAEAKFDAYVEESTKKYDALVAKFDACKSDLDEALTDNKRLIRRVRLAEADLRDLYKGQGAKVPERLTHIENGNGNGK